MFRLLLQGRILPKNGGGLGAQVNRHLTQDTTGWYARRTRGIRDNSIPYAGVGSLPLRKVLTTRNDGNLRIEVATDGRYTITGTPHMASRDDKAQLGIGSALDHLYGGLDYIENQPAAKVGTGYLDALLGGLVPLRNDAIELPSRLSDYLDSLAPENSGLLAGQTDYLDALISPKRGLLSNDARYWQLLDALTNQRKKGKGLLG